MFIMEENTAEEAPVNPEVQKEEKKKGFFEKIKDKFSKKKEAAEEAPEKKGFFEKVKQKFKKKEEEKPEQQAEEETKQDEPISAAEETGEEKEQR
jgi:hypothetical protein